MGGAGGGRDYSLRLVYDLDRRYGFDHHGLSLDRRRDSVGFLFGHLDDRVRGRLVGLLGDGLVFDVVRRLVFDVAGSLVGFGVDGLGVFGGGDRSVLGRDVLGVLSGFGGLGRVGLDLFCGNDFGSVFGRGYPPVAGVPELGRPKMLLMTSDMGSPFRERRLRVGTNKTAPL